jgi:hypothetical protein
MLDLVAMEITPESFTNVPVILIEALELVIEIVEFVTIALKPAICVLPKSVMFPLMLTLSIVSVFT